MKHKSLFALVLAAALLLTACGGPAQAETEPPMVEYSHPVGITITLPQGFAQIETEGILAGFSNSAEAINVVFEEMLFEEIISYGYDPAAISLEDYARVTADCTMTVNGEEFARYVTCYLQNIRDKWYIMDMEMSVDGVN